MSVQAVFKDGLEHGKYYKIYVSQVNKNGLESPKSEACLKRIGDVDAPPVPVLVLDSCTKDVGFVDCNFNWNTPECDDLSYYMFYYWKNLPIYTEDTTYDKSIVESAAYNKQLSAGATQYTQKNLTNQQYYYFGIQAVDVSNNHSDIYVIRVLAEDGNIPGKPVNPMYLEKLPWAIRVSIDCPYSNQIASVVFFRDNLKQLPPVPFHSGMKAEIIDYLEVMDGLTHFYTYAFIDKNGNMSPRSEPSETVTTITIDTTLIDKVSLNAYLDLWGIPIGASIKQVNAALQAQQQAIQTQAEALANVTQDFSEMYNNYTLMANKIQLISAKVDTVDGVTSALQTQYKQSADAITLQANRIDQVNNTLTGVGSILKVQGDSITSLVSNVDGTIKANITLLQNQMQLKVEKNGIISAINMSPETGVTIKGSKICIDGDTLFTRDARIQGTLSANDITLRNPDGTIIVDSVRYMPIIRTAAWSGNAVVPHGNPNGLRMTGIYIALPQWSGTKRVVINGICYVSGYTDASMGISITNSWGGTHSGTIDTKSNEWGFRTLLSTAVVDNCPGGDLMVYFYGASVQSDAYFNQFSATAYVNG